MATTPDRNTALRRTAALFGRYTRAAITLAIAEPRNTQAVYAVYANARAAGRAALLVK